MRATKVTVLALLLVMIIVFSSFSVSEIPVPERNHMTVATSTEFNYTESPSYLFLNNWINSTAWVYTGVPDQYLTLSGPLTISDISVRQEIAPACIIINNHNVSHSAYLSKNNIIHAFQNDAEEEIVYPPGSDQFIVNQNSGNVFEDTVNITGNVTYSTQGGNISIFTHPQLNIFSDALHSSIEQTHNELVINLTFASGSSFMEVGINNYTFSTFKNLSTENLRMVSNWLASSLPVKLNGPLLEEYHMSLLLVKDDQNPYTGEFIASPSSIYLYSWARDSSFAAIAMEKSGHIDSAIKYWRWMGSEQGNESVNGTWSTRFNFWTGAPDTGWVNPEYDSVGIFQMGIYYLYEVTKNASLIEQFLPELNASIRWEDNAIQSHGLLPEDYSIWEDVDAYNFWTQAMDAVGMCYTSNLYSELNLSHSYVSHNWSKLHESIMKYFLQKDDSMFAEYLEPLLGDSNVPYSAIDIYDSSAILPISLGLINPNSTMAHRIVANTVHNLSIAGGLARFFGDTYHYLGFPSDSGGPMPPWIITTMFEAYYDETVGDNSGALTLLNWATNHSQSGLLAEAINPKNETPLPTTSPLTWSSAMFILVSLHYNTTHIKPDRVPLVLYIIIGVVAVVGVSIVYFLLISKPRRNMQHGKSS
jgi:GH15 family glucan-1,4-alpha-glucosidase